ncbi:response regulator transcription factor [Flavobacterium sp. RSB2_4_14]|uniref:response regulator transcription factor n=1 Tax=Flavobacterium sp. RSB2_4_14 TaxID=3447665 RepID=UPI003F385056
MNDYKDYTLFQKFIEQYESTGFTSINRNDRLILELEDMLEKNNQYFFIADIFQSKIIFASKKSKDIIGVESDKLNPYHGVEATHPDEVYRHTKGWAKLICLANDLFVNQNGSALLSVNMKMRNPKGTFSEVLYQCYLFYRNLPYKTVYDLQVHTNIDNIKVKKNGYHYHVGNDISNFKYPDEEFLKIGNDFTKRELEIIKQIELGLSSGQIADKLFLSHYTVNAHRTNILKKTNKASMHELIHELTEKGII